MKKNYLKGWIIALFTLIVFVSCDREWKGDSKMNFSMKQFKSSVGQKLNIIDLPDTNKFILFIKKSDGEIVYKGLYGDKPNDILVSPGVYDVMVYSFEFDTPQFNAPQYGDIQIVEVNGEDKVSVTFLCRQLNSGIRLFFSDVFKGRFYDGKMVLRSENKFLEYPYNENRIAYFKKGRLDICLYYKEKEEILLSRNLNSSEILSLKLSASIGDEGGITIAVDTSRIWLDDEFIVGGKRDGSSAEKAFYPTDLKDHIGEKEVWAMGYSVGYYISASTVKFEIPKEEVGNIALAQRISSINISDCIPVELPKGAIRDALNLFTNPSYLNRKVAVKGDIESPYYGVAGLKNIKEYQLY